MSNVSNQYQHKQKSSLRVSRERIKTAAPDDPQTGAKIRWKTEGKRNVATRLVAGGKLSAFRETAEIPLKPRSARIRKGSLSAPFSLSLSFSFSFSPLPSILFPSLSVILSCTFSRGVTCRCRAEPLNSKLLSPQSSSHRRSRRLGSSFPPFVSVRKLPNLSARFSIEQQRAHAAINNRYPSLLVPPSPLWRFLIYYLGTLRRKAIQCRENRDVYGPHGIWRRDWLGTGVCPWQWDKRLLRRCIGIGECFVIMIEWFT